MIIDKYKNKYRTTSTRLKNWDYSQPGAYFITICTKNKTHDFGQINDGQMELSEIGNIANTYWTEIPSHFKNVNVDQFVIMPNHMHGIITIYPHVATPDPGVETPNQIVPTPDMGVDVSHIHKPAHSTPKLGDATSKWKPATIGVMINQYKRIVTINARKINPTFAWQPRFHDHIIRNEQSLQKIQEYIINNPLKWHLDKYYEQ